MNDLPVILSYFAQSQDQAHLDMLQQEANAIQLAWEKATDQPQNPISVKYVARGNGLSNQDRIIEDIKLYGNRIVLFHFSGHAGHDELLLNDGAGGPDGIAGLLAAYAPNLKLVVLNGCSTRDQVATFFRRSIRAMVATQCAVKDTHAKDFAISFHQTLCAGKSIQDAYRDAILLLRTKQLDKLLPESVSESAQTRGMLDTRPTTETIWGLYTQDTGPAIVTDINWWRITYQLGKPRINPEKAYVCERSHADYVDIFNGYFDPYRNPNRPRIQHYLLAGARPESPLGLIRKLFYESIMQTRNRQFYYYSFSDLFNDTKVVDLSRSDVSAVHVLSRLLLAVAGPPPPFVNVGIRSADDLCTEIFNQNAFKQREFVFIAFRIQADDLTDANIKAIGEAITYLNHQESNLPTGQPSFLFFWTVVQEKTFWNSLFSSSPLKKLIARFDAIRTDNWQWYVINKDYKFLKVPAQDDIDNWLNDHYRPFSTTSPDETFVQTLYRQTNVETLENQLLDLIEAVNSKPT
ncbi:CHAT domain-containing protein [Spirosoma jeollabukense]